MSYKIRLIQKDRDNAGEVTRILLRVENENIESQDYVLTPEERDAYLLDDTTIVPIAEKVAAELEIRLEAEAPTKPQPTVVEPQEKLDSFVIADNKVEAKKIAKKAELEAVLEESI